MCNFCFKLFEYIIYLKSELLWINNNLQESLKRPISGSDFGYEIPLKDPRGLEAIMSKEDVTGEGTADGDACDVDKYVLFFSLLNFLGFWVQIFK